MSLESEWRLGVVVVPVSRDGRRWAIPTDAIEDWPKSERIWGNGENYVSLQDQWQFLGGGVKRTDMNDPEYNEWWWRGWDMYSATIFREILEEAKLPRYSSDQVTELPGTFAVEQIGRASGDAKFVVATFQMILAKAHLDTLIERGAVPVDSGTNLRERDKWIVEQICPLPIGVPLEELVHA